jgi:hypothetical protein
VVGVAGKIGPVCESRYLPRLTSAKLPRLFFLFREFLGCLVLAKTRCWPIPATRDFNPGQSVSNFEQTPGSR